MKLLGLRCVGDLMAVLYVIRKELVLWEIFFYLLCMGFRFPYAILINGMIYLFARLLHIIHKSEGKTVSVFFRNRNSYLV